MKQSVFQYVEITLKASTMKAAVFHKPGDISYTTVADPRIELATDINSLPLSEVAQGKIKCRWRWVI